MECTLLYSCFMELTWDVFSKLSPFLRCGPRTVVQKTLESPLDSKEIKPVTPKGNQPLNIHWEDWYWSWSTNTLATCCEEPTHWKRPWCWERLRAGGERGDRGCNGWMHHWLSGHGFEQTQGGSEGQESLACCHPWVAKTQTPLSDLKTTKNVE